ncbi:MAG: dethiobiotin synthase [Bacteroidetes bacterium]|nr:dethiobiotin synthase [Bacteroidota bacterium]MBV6459981.1 ATP-dependent dethiobiotin synthetase BioD [Flavobacteriales bacterium]WKZ76376.1 MAG: dethiobiotin synthase [Vicingaceae bacterium]MCL4816296.1 dethiobiotin synthase [Flavobacteriales bacterium]NOG95376.1 dethiobiotin synthase [Bacteroidota bacterium]
MRKIFITGIGTDVGKTIVSAVLAQAWRADYWKPVQAGKLPETDSETVKKLLTNKISNVWPENYLLENPVSPHYAASLENKIIQKAEMIPPPSSNKILLIEGAGGLMVPLNDEFLIIDLISKLNAETIVVSKNYLGSINHTLLTINTLFHHKIPVLGIIFNGEENTVSEQFILKYTGLKMLGRIEKTQQITREWIAKEAVKFSTL